MDSESKRIDYAQKIHERARYLRGRFLNFVAVIERDIAIILTDYFCTSDSQKRELFFRQIATRFLSLKAKKEILIEIVKKDYPNYWGQHSAILRNLDEIINFRNKLAHSVVDVSESALARPIDNGIGFVDWNKGEPITDEQFQDWEIKTQMVLSSLSDVKRLLPFKENPKP
jgi:hypothetical protein